MPTLALHPDPELFPDLWSPAPPPEELKAMGKPLTQIAPGQWVSGLPEFNTPSHVLCRLRPGTTPGTYTLEPEPWPGYIRLTRDLGQHLGVLGLSHTTLRRLIYCGFIDHIRAAPGCIFLSIESIMDHFRATSNDCGKEKSFWTPQRRELWRTTYDFEISE